VGGDFPAGKRLRLKGVENRLMALKRKRQKVANGGNCQSQIATKGNKFVAAFGRFLPPFLTAFFPQRTRWGMVSTQNSAFHTVRFFAFSRFA